MSDEMIEKIKLLSDEYGFKKNKIIKWYEILQEYPCFREESAESCLEIVCQRRTSALTKILTDMKDGKPVEKEVYSETVQKSIESAIFDTYGDEATPYLSEEFREEKGLHLDIDNFDYDYPEDYHNCDDYDVKIH